MSVMKSVGVCLDFVWLCFVISFFLWWSIKMPMKKWNPPHRRKTLTWSSGRARGSELLRGLTVVPWSMDAVLIIAGSLRAIGVATAPAGAPGAQVVALLGGGCLLGGRYIHRSDQVVPAARLKGWRALVLVIAPAPGSRSREDQIVQGTRIATRRSLSSRVDSLILLQLIWRQPSQAMVIVWGLLTGLVGALRLSLYGCMIKWRHWSLCFGLTEHFE